MIKTISAATLAVALFGAAGASHAQVISTIPITPSNTDPTMTSVFLNGQPCNIGSGAAHHYKSVEITVSAAGSYNMGDLASVDGGYAIYSGVLNPADLAQNCVASVDTGHNWTLAAGTYTLVGGPWSAALDGTYELRFNGPGTVALVAPAAVPTMSEWAMILFGTILAGAAALFIHRRRTA